MTGSITVLSGCAPTVTPTSTATNTPTDTPTSTPTDTFTITPTATNTFTPEPTFTPVGLINGHVVFQGSTQPDPKQAQGISLVICAGSQP